MLTQRNLAERLGLSQQTVSLCFRQPQRVAEGTCRRVLAAAARTGYRPHATARAMRQGRFGCAALLLSTVRGRSHLPGGLLDGIDHALAEHGLHLTLARLDDDHLTSAAYLPKVLREWSADGLLINYNKAVPPALPALVARFRIPAVWLNARRRHDCVYPDDLDAGRAATEHLLRLGHRRIAFVGLESNAGEGVHYSQIDRRRGYEQALRGAGASPCVVPHRRGAGFDQHVQAAAAALRRPDRSTAVVAYSRNCALPMYAAALSSGFTVPRDLTILCFLTEATDLPLPLALMTAPQAALGRAAVAMLLAKLHRPGRRLKPRGLPFVLRRPACCAPPPPA